MGSGLCAGSFAGDRMKELVTVVVPVYKTEKYLRRCVESILRQDHRELEVILVNDGSPDSCGSICDYYAQTVERVRVVHKANGGLSSARNAGIEAAIGKYICFVDSDDYIETDYVSTLYRLLRTFDADLAKIDYVEVRTDDYHVNNREAKETVYEGRAVEKAFLDLRVDSACVFMYKRTLIGDTRFQEGKTSEDIPFNFHIFHKAKRFVYLPVGKYYYYQNPTSISNGPLNKQYFNYLNFRKDIYDYYKETGDSALIEKAEVLYARAAMGMMARMCLFGLASGLDKKAYKKTLSDVFSSHANVFYHDPDTAFSRKALAVLVFHFYPLVKLIRLYKK